MCPGIFHWAYTVRRGCGREHARLDFFPSHSLDALELSCVQNKIALSTSAALNAYFLDLRISHENTCEKKVERDRTICRMHRESCADHILCDTCELCKQCVYISCADKGRWDPSPVLKFPPVLTVKFNNVTEAQLETNVTITASDDGRIAVHRLSAVGVYQPGHFVTYAHDNNNWYLYNDLKTNRSAPGYVAVEDLGPVLPAFSHMNRRGHKPELWYYTLQFEGVPQS